MRGELISLFWFALLTTIDLAFLEQFLSFMFAPILTVYIFPMVIMSQSLNPLISRQKPNCFGYAGLYGLNNYVSPLNSKVSKFELHHYHD